MTHGPRTIRAEEDCGLALLLLEDAETQEWPMLRDFIRVVTQSSGPLVKYCFSKKVIAALFSHEYTVFAQFLFLLIAQLLLRIKGLVFGHDVFQLPCRILAANTLSRMYAPVFPMWGSSTVFRFCTTIFHQFSDVYFFYVSVFPKSGCSWQSLPTGPESTELLLPVPVNLSETFRWHVQQQPESMAS